MTQSVDTNQTWPSDYYQYGWTCSICGQWAQAGHVCSTFVPTWTYTPPPADPFIEFKKLYRKLILDDLLSDFTREVEDKFKDKIDKPIRQELIDEVYVLALGLIREEPNP